MSRNIKNLLKLLAISCIAIFFAACEREAYDIEETLNEQSLYNVVRLNLEDVSDAEKIKNKVKDIQSQIAGDDSNKSQNILRDLMVDIKYPTLIESGNYKSYTFVASLPGEKSLLNLLLSLQGDGSYKSILIRYNVTEEEKVAISVDPTSVNLSGKVDYVNLEEWVPSDWSGRTIYEDAFGQCPAGKCCSIALISGGDCNCFQIEAVISACGGAAGSGGGDTGASGSNVGGYEGSGGGGGGNGTGTGVSSGSSSGPSGPLEDPDCIADASGNCAGDVTLLVLPDILDDDEDPITDPIDIENCMKIAEQIADVDFQEKVQILRDNFDGEAEKSFAQDMNGTFAPGTVSDDGHTAYPPINQNSIGSLHNHLNDMEVPDRNGDGIPDMDLPIRYHSPKDINQFIILLKWADLAGRPLSDVYQSMYSSSGNYTLKFSGDIDDLTVLSDSEVEELTLKYEEVMESGRSRKKVLLFMKEEMDIDGVDVFQIQNNGVVKKRYLDENNRVKTEKC